MTVDQKINNAYEVKMLSTKCKLVLGTVMSFGLLAAINGCSSSSSGGSAAVNEFSSLPEVTGPVTTNGSLSVIGSLAAAGVPLSSPGTFSPGSSLQMCENVNLLKEIMREAAQPDKILCYMGAMKSANVLPSTLNIADGTTKYVKLINLPDESATAFRSGSNPTPYIKFEIVKTNGAISSFKMYSCFDGTAMAPQQSEYISQTFTGTTATVSSKYTGSDSGATFGSEINATGNFTSAWESKNISGQRYYSDGSGSNKMTLDMDQYSNQINMSIAMQGRYGADTFINRFYTVAQLLGDKLANFAIGDGSSKVDMSWDQGTNGVDFTDTATHSWNGDSRAIITPATNGSYYSAASAGTVPAAPGAPSAITFTGGEAWDCTLPNGQTWIEADFASGGAAIVNGMTACEDKFLSSGDWIACPY